MAKRYEELGRQVSLVRAAAIASTLVERKVCGIDPGIAHCGYGVIICQLDGHLRRLTSGTIVTRPHTPEVERLEYLSRSIGDVFRRTAPDVVAMEALAVGRNISTVMLTSEAVGIIIEAAHKYAIPVVRYTPPAIKLAVGGSGRVDKQQLSVAVMECLGCELRTGALHESDALAVAIMHAEVLKQRERDG